MDQTAKRISDYAASLSFSDITPEAIHAVKRSLVDSMGCALAAFSAEPIKIVRRLASQMSSTSAMSASVLGTLLKTHPEMAAFVNGFMVRYLDFNDSHPGKDHGGHPSDMISAIMAISEALHADGKSLACGITIAYEVVGQLNDSAKLNGWDHVSYEVIGSVLGAGKILGLSKEQMAHALSLAITPNIALSRSRMGELSMWKAGAGANASRNGLFAALLASEGMTGPSDPIEGRYGLMDKVTEPFELESFGGKGGRFKIEDTFFKPRPIMYYSLILVEAALDLREKVDINNIESIRIAPARLVHDLQPQDFDPQTRETADHSEPYAVVATLVDGEISEKTFAPERFRDPQMLALLKKVSIIKDLAYWKDAPATLCCRIEITEKSGKKYIQERKNNRGHPANPMSDNEIEEKFCKLTDKVLTPRQTRTALDLMWHLEELDDVSKIFDTLVV